MISRTCWSNMYQLGECHAPTLSDLRREISGSRCSSETYFQLMCMPTSWDYMTPPTSLQLNLAQMSEAYCHTATSWAHWVTRNTMRSFRVKWGSKLKLHCCKGWAITLGGGSQSAIGGSFQCLDFAPQLCGVAYFDCVHCVVWLAWGFGCLPFWTLFIVCRWRPATNSWGYITHHPC